LIAAIVHWNSTDLADAVAHLRGQGEVIPDDLLAHVSPVRWKHIGFSGDFLWERAATSAAEGRKPLKLADNRWAA
jgi:hypothetical protein